MERKARTIKLAKGPFEEELLPQQTLLYIYFEDRWGNFFKWTPKWSGVEKIFFKAMEVEEENNPEGPWSEELKKASERIPSLREFKLPVRIEYSGLHELDEEGWRYKIGVSILPDGESVGTSGQYGKGFYIGDCYFKMPSFIRALLEKIQACKVAISKECTDLGWTPDGSIPGEGICFYIWLEEGLERTDYQIASREIAGVIRSYIRGVILDSRSIKRGFEDI